MTTFYICRHGQTENNKNLRLSGWIDTPLTDEGLQNAASAAAKLKGRTFDAVAVSDLGRAFITGYLITRKLGYTDEIKTYKGLREVSYGDLANIEIAKYPIVTTAENTDFAPPNGESLAQMQQRVMTCIEALSAEYPDKTVLITAHDGTINAVYATFTGEAMGPVDAKSHNGHDFVAKFVYQDGKVTSFEEITS